MESSTVYSMGTALSRAQSNGTVVGVLVGSDWLAGLVVGCDGHGVVIETDPREHVVVRMEAVSAVRVHARVPQDSGPQARPAGAPEPRPSYTPVPAQAGAY